MALKKHTIPAQAHGDTLPVTDIRTLTECKGEAKHDVGTEIEARLPFDHLEPVPIAIRGLDAATLPPPEVVAEHNMTLNLLMGKFTGLVIEFSGGDFGAVRYQGRATGVTFTNTGQTSHK